MWYRLLMSLGGVRSRLEVQSFGYTSARRLLVLLDLVDEGTTIFLYISNQSTRNDPEDFNLHTYINEPNFNPF
jgi:hypothetical protein